MNATIQTNNIQERALALISRVQAHPGWQSLQNKFHSLSPFHQKLVLACSPIALLSVLFASLYLIFGKIVVFGFAASIVAGLATGLGALPVLFFKEVPSKVFSIMLGAAAGVMLAATAFSLIVPGIEYGDRYWSNNGVFIVAIGMLIGAIFLDLTDRTLPKNQLYNQTIKLNHSFHKIWLFIFAITLHNFPEGIAVGVSFGTDEIRNGVVLAAAIAAQNIPEGLAVAMPLAGLGMNRRKAVLIGTLTGLAEPVGGLLGVTAVTLFQSVLPIAMGFAAGARRY